MGQFTFFFGTKFSKSNVCVFYSFSTSQSGISTFQALSGHMWLVATLQTILYQEILGGENSFIQKRLS